MSETRDTCFRCGGKGVIEATPMACGVRCWDECPACGDKAEISRLTARIEELEKALKPFARHLDAIEREGRWSDEQWAPMDVFDGHKSISHVAIGDLRFARSTLEAGSTK